MYACDCLCGEYTLCVCVEAEGGHPVSYSLFLYPRPLSCGLTVCTYHSQLKWMLESGLWFSHLPSKLSCSLLHSLATASGFQHCRSRLSSICLGTLGNILECVSFLVKYFLWLFLRYFFVCLCLLFPTYFSYFFFIQMKWTAKLT